jgi:predicted transcriptional regulator
MDLLKQQGIKELLSVHEIEVNGQLDSRQLGYEYTLSDGRKIRQYEDDPDTQDRESSLTQEQEDEIINLLRADEYVTIGFEKKEVRGRTFSFERNRFVLSDGTEVIKSIGRPSEDSQNIETTVDIDPKEADQILNDKREIANLREQDKRKLIAVDELMANGELDRRVFVYRYQLSDGRTKDLREGDELNVVRNRNLRGDELNYALNKKQRQEWVQLKNAGSGEDIGTYEQKVKDHLFVFKRQRFTLSDGTELIWSYGTLKDDQ